MTNKSKIKDFTSPSRITPNMNKNKTKKRAASRSPSPSSSSTSSKTIMNEDYPRAIKRVKMNVENTLFKKIEIKTASGLGGVAGDEGGVKIAGREPSSEGSEEGGEKTFHMVLSEEEEGEEEEEEEEGDLEEEEVDADGDMVKMKRFMAFAERLGIEEGVDEWYGPTHFEEVKGDANNDNESADEGPLKNRGFPTELTHNRIMNSLELEREDEKENEDEDEEEWYESRQFEEVAGDDNDSTDEEPMKRANNSSAHLATNAFYGKGGNKEKEKGSGEAASQAHKNRHQKAANDEVKQATTNAKNLLKKTLSEPVHHQTLKEIINHLQIEVDQKEKIEEECQEKVNLAEKELEEAHEELLTARVRMLRVQMLLAEFGEIHVPK
ncbi:MAG: hypothetical protein M1823_001290 [Watsoniomyces obsoletus]|nr:MAG: hypothetical protein M1823_001290 [Watsoniomyces obsoletus]